MQVVEYLEECVLGTRLVGKLMNVVYDEDIHRLIVVQEVRHGVLLNRVHIMGNETVGSDIENHFPGIFLLYLYAYGLCQMGLSQTGATVYKKRIVCCASGVLRNGQSGSAAQTVAVSFYEILKRIVVVEIGIDRYALDAWNHIRVVDLLHLFLGQGYVRIDDPGVRSAGRIAYGGVLHY